MLFGNLCALDTKPSSLTQEEKDMLQNMALFLSYAIDLEFTAYTDTLTNIHNRSFLQELDRMGEIYSRPFAILFIDIDNFKYVNDRFGHDGGDFVLKEVVSRINSNLREGDLILRFAGDEFLVFIMSESTEEIDAISQLFLDTLQNPIYYQNHELYLSVSIGISLYPLHDQSLRGLIMKSDLAMYAAKKDGKNLYLFYSEEMDNREDYEIDGSLLKNVINGQHEIIRMITDECPIDDILQSITTFVEEQTDGLCSILLYQKDSQTLKYKAGSSLSKEYIKSIDGINIGPLVGSCGTAAYLKERVIVTDINIDDKWSNFCDIASKHGLRACWSTPILTNDNELLGTFAIYYERVHSPNEMEKDLVDRATFLLKLALERESKNTEIGQLATIDHLTKLPNQQRFREFLHLSCEKSHKDRYFAIFNLDLDEFNSINIAFGYSNGDQIIKRVSNRLVAALPTNSNVYRVGGDEFAIYVPCHQGEVSSFLNVIEGVFEEPFILQDNEIKMSTSIGVSIFPQDGISSEELIRKSTKSMMKVKKEKNSVSIPVYSASREEELKTIALTSDLYRAIERNELYVEYQPQHHIQSKQVVGFEALVRWHHPRYGYISPDKFIRIAEKTGVINTIGKWVMEKACIELKKLHEQGYSNMRMGVNLSAYQIKKENFVSEIKRLLSKIGISPTCLDLEITEGMMIEVEVAQAKLQELHKLGVLISLDDFGTGFSSLGYLTRFPINQLKIDKSFIQRVGHIEDEMIIKTIIAMAQTLNINVIAEGVETAEQQLFLEKEECDEVQGYLFSKPLPADQLSDYLQKEIYY